MNMNQENWYYTTNGNDEVGPVSKEKIISLLENQVLTPDSEVWHTEFSDWKHIRDISDIDWQSATSGISNDTPLLKIVEIEKELPTNWLFFYTYIRIPLGLIIGIAETVYYYSDVLDPGSKIIILLVTIIDTVLYLLLFIGLHKRKLWGWRFNWFILIAETLLRPVESALTMNTYIISVGIFFLIWFLPNSIYFRKRRHLFS